MPGRTDARENVGQRSTDVALGDLLFAIGDEHGGLCAGSKSLC